MVDWYGNWTYEPNTPAEKKCDCDRIADWIVETGYKVKTTIENLVEMILLYIPDELEFSIENCIDFIEGNGLKEFDYFC